MNQTDLEVIGRHDADMSVKSRFKPVLVNLSDQMKNITAPERKLSTSASTSCKTVIITLIASTQTHSGLTETDYCTRRQRVMFGTKRSKSRAN